MKFTFNKVDENNSSFKFLTEDVISNEADFNDVCSDFEYKLRRSSISKVNIDISVGDKYTIVTFKLCD